MRRNLVLLMSYICIKKKKGVRLYEVKRFIHRSGACRGFGANVKEREKSDRGGGEEERRNWKAQYPKTFYEPPTHRSLYKYASVCVYI